MTSAIWKRPVTGPVAVEATNLAGDRQADPSVHGGPHKAVYVYAAEHYPYWSERLHRDDLEWGSFGENFTIEGAPETVVHIGDHLEIGSARFVVTAPRSPCYKLNVRFEREDMVRLFWESGRPGYYLGIERKGSVRAGDTVHLERSPRPSPTVDRLFASRSVSVARGSE